MTELGGDYIPEVDFEVRRKVADRLTDRCDVIVAETVAAFPMSGGARRLDSDYSVRLGKCLVRLLADALVDGRVDPRATGLGELGTLVDERELSHSQLFRFVHVATNAAVDEASLVGAGAVPGPRSAQLLRLASFDLLAGWVARRSEIPPRATIEDPITTLHTRAVFDAALAKECHRAERLEHWLSVLLTDVDHLAAVNRAVGYGIGDRILERLGILLRSYFRQHDWVARYDSDTVAVLLPETTPADAMLLAERMRGMVEDRLSFRDHRTDERAVVTVSVASASARAIEGDPIEPSRLLAEAESALGRAKAAGRNRVAQVELQPRMMSVDEAATALKASRMEVEQMLADGRLQPIYVGRHVRLDRASVGSAARGRLR